MMFVNYFGVFSWISRKMDKISKNLGNFGVLCRGIGIPTQQRRSTPLCGMIHHGVAEREALGNLGYVAT